MQSIVSWRHRDNPTKGIDMATHKPSYSRHRLSRFVRRLERMWSALALALLSLPAYAVDLLTNQWAVASAVITIAAIGYRMKYGMMDKRKALVSIIGIVVVFGAVLIVDEIRT